MNFEEQGRQIAGQNGANSLSGGKSKVTIPV